MGTNKEKKQQSRTVFHWTQTHFSIYDIVAGRVKKGLHNNREPNEIRKSGLPAISPDEYIMNRHDFFEVYPFVEHKDLPSSYLMEAVHNFFSRRCRDLQLQDTYNRYDATSLIAIAIEIEERLKQLLGPNDHLLFAKEKKNSDDDVSSIDIDSDDDEQINSQTPNNEEDDQSKSHTENNKNDDDKEMS